MLSCIYKLTRKDGKEYIGITKNFKKRFNEHKRSDTFKLGIEKFEILFEGERNECELKEGFFIKQHDTYLNGLNKTKTGKGQNFFLTTLDFKFSEESRKKMSKSAKGKHNGEKNGMFGKTHSVEAKRKMKLAHNEFLKNGNVYWSKITKEQAKEIRNLYANKKWEISKDDVLQTVKKSQINIVKNMDKIDYSILKTKNGEQLTYYTMFCISISKKYNVHSNNIRKILKGETWTR